VSGAEALDKIIAKPAKPALALLIAGAVVTTVILGARRAASDFVRNEARDEMTPTMVTQREQQKALDEHTERIKSVEQQTQTIREAMGRIDTNVQTLLKHDEDRHHR
jgi:uncharacterized membrane protein (DUF106 family)